MDSSLARRFGAVTAAEVAALDAAAVELGVSLVQLMEAAGIQVARLAWRMIGRRRRAVHVVAGRGHNGGDGLVAARHLASWGCRVSAAVVADAGALDDVLRQQCRAASGAGVTMVVDPEPAASRAPRETTLLIDALAGTGFREPLRPQMAAVIEALAGMVLSVDVPSGLDVTAPRASAVAVRAAATCTLAAVKRAFWEPDGRDHTGVLYLADIGLPRGAWERCGLVQPSAARGGGLHLVPGVAEGATGII